LVQVGAQCRGMAWRIHASVIRGEIDNRQKGLIRGKVWLDGLERPIELELAGNACADLAGCLLKFSNRQPTVPMRKDAAFAFLQRGRIGDLTASRKVRVFDLSLDKACALIERGEKPPEHMANSLYLEWFSESQGRIVIESADFDLEISAPEWQITAEEEKQRLADASAGWDEFISRLDAALEKHQRGAKDPDAHWDEHDYERFLKESDARTDKYIELLDKFGHSPEAHEKIEREMGWSCESTDEEATEDSGQSDETNADYDAADEPLPEPDPLREGIDWIRTEDGEVRHPLQHRCFEAAIQIWERCKEVGLEEGDDEDLDRFLFEFQTISAKLAGALGSIAEGHGCYDPAFTVACLKRALDHLHKCQAGLETVGAKQCGKSRSRLLPEALVADARRDLFEIRQSILRLMQEYRSRQ
jgi:hypothetical protein